MQKIQARTLHGIYVLYVENENLFSIKLVIQFVDNVKGGLQMHNSTFSNHGKIRLTRNSNTKTVITHYHDCRVNAVLSAILY